MRLRRWNYETKKYDVFEVPDDWNVKLFLYDGDDMDEMVNCPSCGKLLPLGDTYTSHEIHDLVGFGYWICGKCHKEELERRRLDAQSAI